MWKEVDGLHDIEPVPVPDQRDEVTSECRRITGDVDHPSRGEPHNVGEDGCRTASWWIENQDLWVCPVGCEIGESRLYRYAAEPALGEAKATCVDLGVCDGTG